MYIHDMYLYMYIHVHHCSHSHPLPPCQKDAHSSNGSLSDRHRETDLGRLQTNVLSGSDAEVSSRERHLKAGEL